MCACWALCARFCSYPAVLAAHSSRTGRPATKPLQGCASRQTLLDATAFCAGDVGRPLGQVPHHGRRDRARLRPGDSFSLKESVSNLFSRCTFLVSTLESQSTALCFSPLCHLCRLLFHYLRPL